MSAKHLIVFGLFLSVCLYVFIHVMREKGRAAVFRFLLNAAWPIAIVVLFIMLAISLSTGAQIKLF